jgi:hypothetical protein
MLDRPVCPGSSSDLAAIDGGSRGWRNSQQGSGGESNHGCAQHLRTSFAGSDVSLVQDKPWYAMLFDGK